MDSEGSPVVGLCDGRCATFAKRLWRQEKHWRCPYEVLGGDIEKRREIILSKFYVDSNAIY